jgi:AAHS family benzoate transporter-like MFS transporter
MRYVDIYPLAAEAKLNSFHWQVLFWCSLILIIDGYDLQLAGIALPSIMAEMQVTETQAGLMVSSVLVGMTAGSILLGTLADRIGRRLTIAICVVLFSVCTAGAGLTKDPILFTLLRFLGGMGLGGVLPGIIAHITEYTPRKIRATVMTLVFSGASVGGVVAAAVGKGFIENYGWQSVFFAAGLPVLMVPLMMRSLPESMAFLIRTGRIDELKSVVQKIDPSYQYQPGDQFRVPDAKSIQAPSVGSLFSGSIGRSTAMFWLAMCMCLGVIYGLNSSLTLIMARAGHSIDSALTFVLVLNVGAITGTLIGGRLADKFPIKKVLLGMYLTGIASIVLLGVLLGTSTSTGLLLLIVGVIGASTIGTQLLTIVYVGVFYPPNMVGTAAGWAGGVGRAGAIAAPVAMGAVLGMNLPIEVSFMIIAIPTAIGMLAIALIDHSQSEMAQAAKRADTNAISAVNEAGA